MRIAVDWDATLVDPKTKDWLPGAPRALRRLVNEGHKVVIHSCRANWDEGREEIRRKLASERLILDIVGKPDADLYLDDRAVRFHGWPDALNEVHALAIRSRLERMAVTRSKLRHP